jgi:hypothetical protein
MEKNTFATSAYIGVSARSAYEYLIDMSNLDEWTLSSRMKEKVDENTWLGTASGYQAPLYYHLRRMSGLPFYSIEWHCGLKYKEYYHVYPVFLFPANYVDPREPADGVYFHWISFVGPKRRTPLIMEGIDIVHTSETRALKASLESRAGHSSPVLGRHRLRTETVYVDAPVELVTTLVGDVTQVGEWTHLRHIVDVATPTHARLRDEYGRMLQLEHKVHRYGSSVLIESDATYDNGQWQVRTPTLITPCSYAFGESKARGCLVHRMTFVPTTGPGAAEFPQDDMAAENLNIKRVAEGRAGNLESLGRGLSYLDQESLEPS